MNMAAPVTIEEQLEMPSERGRQIGDEAKAKEGLLDIGFYRLGE